MKTALVEGPEPQTLALTTENSLDRSLLFGNSPSAYKEKKSSVKSSLKLRTQQDEESCNEDLDWTTEFPYTHPAGFEDEERHSYLRSIDLSQLVRKHSRQSRIDDYIEKYEFTPNSYRASTGADINDDGNDSEDSSRNSRSKKKSSLSKSVLSSNTRRRKKKTLKNSFDTIFSPIYTFFQKPKTPTTPPAHEHEEEPMISTTNIEEYESDNSLTVTPMVLDDPEQPEDMNHMNMEHCDAANLEQDPSERPFLVEDMEPYEFIAALPNANDICNFPSLCVPSKNPSDPQITLVLDLDETLVHCSTDPCQSADLIFPVYFGGTEYLVYAKKRPFLDYFLSEIRKYFEVIVFTASQQAYADTILNLLDPEGSYFRHRAFRDSCVFIEGNFLKDLRVLGRDLSKCVILDNSPQAFGLQVENGIPITTWVDDSEDRELLDLLPFLKQLSNCEDVRPFLSKRFHLADLVAHCRNVMYMDSTDRFHFDDEKDIFVTVS
ncbi:CTD small phosphatase-like protein 2 [Galdieria sulphuraria]|uniref:CTD small phosphatase like isoform 1 n=1 Tax=Galdieria sulphuraria TaxID=130081 RepID=M2VTB3_GALSU|nr:CTD small phosphatase like isoform 1 [Galdieria sulphuraria]XP_005702947.1 CTD small phosphatase like isoform 2 [Galdieria sulphuraria]EME26426.1 CTD small phosphatase like isoform 1 [Galdieria sulphuraria]EME26427.1 CTD small phosphatase like isoform 2 [Galdieria sulphuraria]GJD12334.1 CTD small phosphatase-like protein 2 [Galdieria sulphuraria]|eukprot:XP_005702946.1 CTD small phosphatase like isoform 1 [Galdieria sulphuraria]